MEIDVGLKAAQNNTVNLPPAGYRDITYVLLVAYLVVVVPTSMNESLLQFDQSTTLSTSSSSFQPLPIGAQGPTVVSRGSKE